VSKVQSRVTNYLAASVASITFISLALADALREALLVSLVVCPAVV